MDAGSVGREVIAWQSGRWTTPPPQHLIEGDDLLITAAEGSDAWRTTSYGFIHDDEHARVAPLAVGKAMEVCFTAALTEQFDQAGIFLVSSATEWIKAGVEFSDGVPMLGAVVTHGFSDWSVAPVPTWAGRRVTVRASRGDDSVTIRAKVDDEGWQFVRLAYLPGDLSVEAGPLCCAPTRAGLTVRFHSWHLTDADGSLH